MCYLQGSANLFNEEEFLYICDKFKANPLITEINVRYGLPSYFNRLKSVVQRNRRGEVVFCVIRPDGKIIMTRCKDYPENIYRIPTGGIGHDEGVVEAIFREVKEELGLEVQIRSFAGVIKIRFEHGNEHVMFYSYIFVLDESGGRLMEDVTDDEISEIKEVDIEELTQRVRALNRITGKWHDWGKFRYITSKAALRYLLETQTTQK